MDHRAALGVVLAMLVPVPCRPGEAPEKTVVVIGAHAGDAGRIGGATLEAYRSRGYRGVYAVLAGSPAPARPTEPLEAIQQERESARVAAARLGAEAVLFDLHDIWIWQGRSRAYTGSPSWSRFRPPGSVDITTATRRSQTQAEVARFLAGLNPELVITHCIGEDDLARHSTADLVFRAWQQARRGGARLGQLWFRDAAAESGMLGEPAFRRLLEPLRRGEFYVVADGGEPPPPAPEPRPAPPPAYRPRPGRQPVIMAIGAHADDVEYYAGGVFAKLIREGWKGIYVCATNNTAGCQLDTYSPSRPGGYLNIQKTSGPFPVDALETIQVRKEEARRAAAVLGAEPVFLDLHETFCWIGRRQVYMDHPWWGFYDAPGNGMVTAAAAGPGLALTTELIKKHEPDLVLTHILGDGNPEHGQTGDLAYRAFRRALAGGARLGQLWMSLRNPPQYLAPAPARPDIAVDVAVYAPLNRRALAEHVSQNGGDAKYCPREGQCYEYYLLIVDATKAPGRP